MISNKAKDLIKFYESCQLSAYECPTSLSLPKTKKFWTIGYGNTVYENGNKVKQKDKITQQRADELFDHILMDFEHHVQDLVKVTLNADQLGALVSFAYNVGVENLANSTLLKKVNLNDFKGAGSEFGKWNKSNGKVLNGLVTRRKRESELFLG